MSQVSEAIKAQRAQHRSDHYTDADRALNGQGKKARRAARQENFNAQGNKSAADFDFNQHGKGHIGGQEVRHLMQQGHSREDIMSAAKASGGEIGKRAQKRFDMWGSAKEKAQTVKNNPINTPTGDNSNSQSDSGNQQQTVTQDNDQTSSVTGDNNYVYQNQDNSVRNYGGDTRVFNYQGSGDSATDTPASAATMAGFYSPDDSHGAIAGRVSRNQTLNADAQKKYANTSYIAQGAINNASRNAYIDPAALDKRIADRAKYSRAKATTMGANLFGDLNAIQVPDYQRPEPQKEVETPDFDEMYEKYSDF